MIEIPGLAGFVARAIRNNLCVSIRLREGNDRARLTQKGRVLLTEDMSAGALQRELVERVDGIFSTDTVHLEAMSASDAEVLDVVAAAPRKAVPSSNVTTHDALVRLAMSIDERAERATNTNLDYTDRLLQQQSGHHKELEDYRAFIQELQHLLDVTIPKPEERNPLVDHAIMKLVDLSSNLASAYGLKMAGFTKAPKAIAGPTAEPPSSQGTSNQSAANFKLVVHEGGKAEAADPKDDGALADEPVEAVEVKFKDESIVDDLNSLRGLYQNLADENPERAEEVVDYLIDSIVGMMATHKDRFTPERLGKLLPYIDMAALFSAMGN